MSKKYFLPKCIVTQNQNREILRDYVIEVENGIISNLIPKRQFESSFESNLEPNFENLVLIPGFIQTHIHLCQTLFRGLADDLTLLDWLRLKIFPYENAHNENSLKSSVKLGIHELQTSGTTTILDMGTINHQEVTFDELINSKMRAFSGKSMIDRNELYPPFKESTDDCLNSSYNLAKEYHQKFNGKIKYGFAPRFVLSCSEKLLTESYEMLKDFDNALYHTHASENKDEIKTVRDETRKENVEYFDYLGLLGSSTVLVHCVHLNNTEIQAIKNTNTKIVHCPSSNLKLASGIADIPSLLNEEIIVSLGSDGAPCNNNLNMFTEMRLSALIHKLAHGTSVLNANEVFDLATINGARTLNLQDKIGSIEVGKKADLVFLDLEKSNQVLTDNDESLYSSIVFSGGKDNVKHVMIEGEWVVYDGVSSIYEEKEIVGEGKDELIKLLDRVK
ncbi:amidohydrolase family protein [Bacteroidota bacterium]